MTPPKYRIFVAGAAHFVRIGRPVSAGAAAVTTRIGGSACLAALALRNLGADVTLYSGRGGDADGLAVAAALASAGIKDLALTWLDRAHPGTVAIEDDAGCRIAEIRDTRLYNLLSARSFSRRHLREAMAGCDAALFDAEVAATGIASLMRTFRDRPIAALGASAAAAVRLGPHLADLAMLFLAADEAAALLDDGDAAEIAGLARGLREAGTRCAAVFGPNGDVAILDRGDVTLARSLGAGAPLSAEALRDAVAGAATLAVLEGAAFSEAVRLGLEGSGE